MSQKDEVGLTQAGNLTWKLTPPQRHAGYFKPEWLGAKRKLFPHSVCVCVCEQQYVCVLEQLDKRTDNRTVGV